MPLWSMSKNMTNDQINETEEEPERWTFEITVERTVEVDFPREQLEEVGSEGGVPAEEVIVENTKRELMESISPTEKLVEMDVEVEEVGDG